MERENDSEAVCLLSVVLLAHLIFRFLSPFSTTVKPSCRWISLEVRICDGIGSRVASRITRGAGMCTSSRISVLSSAESQSEFWGRCRGEHLELFSTTVRHLKHWVLLWVHRYCTLEALLENVNRLQITVQRHAGSKNFLSWAQCRNIQLKFADSERILSKSSAPWTSTVYAINTSFSLQETDFSQYLDESTRQFLAANPFDPTKDQFYHQFDRAVWVRTWFVMVSDGNLILCSYCLIGCFWKVYHLAWIVS
jgi:hypothetical protein